MPVCIHLKKKQPFAFAGLWRDPERPDALYLTIITTVPNALLRPIHNRMPVIFDRLSAKQWLDLAFGANEATLAAVIARYLSELKEAHDVLPLINKPEYDRADYINSVADP